MLPLPLPHPRNMTVVSSAPGVLTLLHHQTSASTENYIFLTVDTLVSPQ